MLLQPVALAHPSLDRVDYRNDCTTPLQTSAQPSTVTNSSSLHGSEITGGLNMTMPRPKTCQNATSLSATVRPEERDGSPKHQSAVGHGGEGWRCRRLWNALAVLRALPAGR
jgi:hypothetical protein